jgi:hypothetical protein
MAIAIPLFSCLIPFLPGEVFHRIFFNSGKNRRLFQSQKNSSS